MANSIAKFKNYVDQLDEVYKLASLSSVLDGDATLTRVGRNAHYIEVPKMSMEGLGDYSRANGYYSGDVTLEFEEKEFNYDRGRKFSVDAMDNEETVGLAFGKLSSEFVRTKVVPEMDAVRFAKYATKAISAGNYVEATLSSGADVVSALRACANAMDEDEVNGENRILFITPTLKGVIDDLDTTKSKEVLAKFAQIIEVPQTRFYTAVTLIDGDPTDSSKKIGGYTKASGAKDINFLCVAKDAVLQYTKHNVNKAVSPEENQTKDAWDFFYRAYGLNETLDNKLDGIYCHHKASSASV